MKSTILSLGMLALGASALALPNPAPPNGPAPPPKGAAAPPPPPGPGSKPMPKQAPAAPPTGKAAPIKPAPPAPAGPGQAPPPPPGGTSGSGSGYYGYCATSNGSTRDSSGFLSNAQINGTYVSSTGQTLANDTVTVKGNSFQMFGMVIMENTYYADAVGESFFKKFQNGFGGATNSRVLSNYDAITHPSTPNYIALLAGSTLGSESWSNNPAASGSNTDANSLINMFETYGVSWRWYVEDWPGNCDLVETSGDYGANHVAPLFFTQVQKNCNWCSNIVDSSQFFSDAQNGDLPQFWTYIPNYSNDGEHNNIDSQNSYMESTFTPLLANSTFTKDLVFLVTYDEYGAKDNNGLNPVWTGIAGGAVGNKGNTSVGFDNTTYTHYSVVKTIEDNWNLGTLGNYDSTATTIKTY